jgi:hypothetical protein
MKKKMLYAALSLALATTVAVCGDDDDIFGPIRPEPLNPTLVAEGKRIFRFDTFGDEVFWTDTLRKSDSRLIWTRFRNQSEPRCRLVR